MTEASAAASAHPPNGRPAPAIITTSLAELDPPTLAPSRSRPRPLETAKAYAHLTDHPPVHENAVWPEMHRSHDRRGTSVSAHIGSGTRARTRSDSRAVGCLPVAEKVAHDRAVKNKATIYDDGRIACDDEGITIRWYYLWGAKRIPFQAIRSVRTFPLKPIRGKWRVWGSGDLVHWYNLDPSRPDKETGIEIDAGGRVRPCITPDDVDAVTRILDEHVSP